MSTISPASRVLIAEQYGISDAYLYQCLTGRKAMRPDKAVELEQRTNGALMRWDLRPDDWHRIWPELIGLDGAPAIPAVNQPAAA